MKTNKSPTYTIKELEEHLNKSSEHWISNYVWTFHKLDNGKINGTCHNGIDCCFWEFDTIQEMYDRFDASSWDIIE